MADTTDERVVRLLEEIRDTQREHLERYKEGLRNQADSVAMQRQMQQAAMRRMKLLPWLLGIVMFLIAIVLGMLVRIIMFRYR